MTEVYVVIESPNSGAFPYLYRALGDTPENPYTFILPEYLRKETVEMGNCINIRFLNDEHFQLEHNTLSDKENNTLLLFFSPFHNLSDQFEHLAGEISSTESIHLIRVITFIEANLLIGLSSLTQSWIDATAHFSDVLCITNRSNKNGTDVGKLFKRYEQMRYPMETYTIAHSKKTQVTNILNSTTRRISHIFDPIDLLDDDENPEDDIYLRELPNGNREKYIPIPFQ